MNDRFGFGHALKRKLKRYKVSIVNDRKTVTLDRLVKENVKLGTIILTDG